MGDLIPIKSRMIQTGSKFDLLHCVLVKISKAEEKSNFTVKIIAIYKQLNEWGNCFPSRLVNCCVHGEVIDNRNSVS